MLSSPQPPQLLDRVRQTARLQQLSSRTEEAYVHSMRQFIFFQPKRHPGEMGVPEIPLIAPT